MDYVKGYLLVGDKVILEGDSIQFKLESTGEILEGVLYKAAKKECQIKVEEIIRVEEVDNLADVKKI